MLMDNHKSYMSIQGLNFCKNNGIVVLTLVPHTSNKLQLLDHSIFCPFKKFFSLTVNSWMNANPNTTLNIYELPKLCESAWNLNRAASPENVKSCFKTTGIVLLIETSSLMKTSFILKLQIILSVVGSMEQPPPQAGCESPVIVGNSVAGTSCVAMDAVTRRYKTST